MLYLQLACRCQRLTDIALGIVLIENFGKPQPVLMPLAVNFTCWVLAGCTIIEYLVSNFMQRIMENLDFLIRELCKLPQECEWVEFKTNNVDPEMIGKTISALANGAVLAEKMNAYLVWGIDDKTHEIVGTELRLPLLRKGNSELESWLRSMLSSYADFQFAATDIDGKHIELIIISSARTYPVSFQKESYIRVGSYTKKIA